MDKYIKIILLLLMPISIFAHSLILNLLDNEDGTITIVGAFSTGESASGALVRIIANQSEKILVEKRLDDSSELTIKIPEISYKIVLDGGGNHKVTKEGIPPKGGFKKVQKETKKAQKQNKNNIEVNPSLGILFAISFLLFFATIFISIYNTNRLLNQANIINKKNKS